MLGDAICGLLTIHEPRHWKRAITKNKIKMHTVNIQYRSRLLDYEIPLLIHAHLGR
jgi:hypothetical protein